jgi:hypothetical protein
MTQDEHSRSAAEPRMPTSETPRQRSGLARMSVQYKLSESPNTDPQPTAGQSLLLNTEQQNRLTQISRAVQELNRCIDEQPNARTLEDKWGVFLGEADWYCELHRLLYEEQS